MHTRIKEVREHLGLSQTEFGKRLGISRDAVSNLEYNRLKKPEQKEPIIKLICREFGVSETWLRTGVGEPYEVRTREEEMGDLLGSLMKDSPESFRSRLITALLRFDPDGSEWQVLENIYNSVAAEADENNKETDL